MVIGQKEYRMQRICMHLMVMLTLSILILLSLAFPYEESRYLELVHSEVKSIDQERIIHISSIRQSCPVSLGGDIPISFELVNRGKARISPTKIWLSFMNQQMWDDIPELEPGERSYHAYALPYPADGFLNKQDKLVSLRIDDTRCNIEGFYVYLDTFAPGSYSTADKFLRELNVLVISPKLAMVNDLLNNIRALEPQRYEHVYARPLGDSSLIGTSLHPLFDLQLWEVPAVEPVEKNKFYFETLINGSWRDQTLYTLENRFLKLEAQPLATDVDTVLFVVSDETASDIVRGVMAIWKAATEANKHPLLLVVNGTNLESSASKFDISPSDVHIIYLEKFPSQADIQILRTIHQLIIRGEATLMHKQNLTFSHGSPTGQNARLVVSSLLLAVYISLLIYRLQRFYAEVFCTKSKEEVSKQAPADDLVVESEVVYEDVLNEDVMEPRVVDSQGNFADKVEKFITDLDYSDDSDTEGYHETSAIYLSIEHLIQEDTLRDEALDLTHDSDNIENSSAEIVALTPDSNLVATACEVPSEEEPQATNSKSDDFELEEFEELEVGEENQKEEVIEEVEKEDDEKLGEEMKDEQKDEEKEIEEKEEVDEQKREEGRNDDAKDATAEGQMEEIELSRPEKHEEEEQDENVKSQLITLLTSDFDIIENYQSSSFLENEALNPLRQLAKMEDADFIPTV